ncbi:MAG: hypothetical protein ACOYIP_03060 [Coriobacteriales bacterium]
MSFKFERSVEPETTLTHLVEVLVDGKVIDSSYYTVDTNNNTVSLTPAYLRTLSASMHTITVRFDDVDDDVSAAFSVIAQGGEDSETSGDDQGDDDGQSGSSDTQKPDETAAAGKIPAAGDDTPLAPVCIPAILGIALVFASRRLRA